MKFDDGKTTCLKSIVLMASNHTIEQFGQSLGFLSRLNLNVLIPQPKAKIRHIESLSKSLYQNQNKYDYMVTSRKVYLLSTTIDPTI